MPRRFLIVRPDQTGRTVAETMARAWGLSPPATRNLARRGWLYVDGQPCRQTGRKLRAGQRLEVTRPEHATEARPRPAGGRAKGQPSRPSPGAGGSVSPSRASSDLLQCICIRYVDSDILVVDKPAGLTTVRHRGEAEDFGQRAQRFLPPTLVDLLPEVLARRGIRHQGRIRAVHRLDKETSGLVVLALTPRAESELGRQFRAHAIARTYLALVRGNARDERIESYLVRDRGDGRRGSSGTRPGQRAVTHVRVVKNLQSLTLVECRLETGRTHQVRIHLGERGTPLCGERLYDRPLHGRPLPDPSGAKRPLLHAASLGFVHPIRGKRMEWTSKLPADMRGLLHRRSEGGEPR